MFEFLETENINVRHCGVLFKPGGVSYFPYVFAHPSFIVVY